MAEDKATIQQEIYAVLNDKKFPMRSFVIVDKEGDCVLDSNIHVRFKSCTFTSFKATKGNNNLYFEDCTFDEPNNLYQLSDGRAIFNKCTFNSQFNFERSKVELIDNDINQTIQGNKYTYIKSLRNNYFASGADSSKIGLLITKNSRCESYYDLFKDWQEKSIICKTKSYIKISSPVINDFTGIFIRCDDNSKVQGYNFPALVRTGDNSDKILSVNDHSSIELYNWEKIESGGFFAVATIGSKVKLRNIDTIKNTADNEAGYLFDFDDSHLELSFVKKIETNLLGVLSLKNGADCNIFDLQRLTSNTKKLVFKTEDSVLSIINPKKEGVSYTGNGTGGDDTTAFLSATNSNVYLKNIEEFISNDKIFAGDFTGSKITFINCDTIKSSYSYGIRAIHSNLTFENIKLLYGKNYPALHLDNCTVKINNLEDIVSAKDTSSPIGIYLKQCKVIQKNAISIRAEDNVALSMVDSSYAGFNIKEITGFKNSAIKLEGSNNLYLSNTDLIKGNSCNGIDGENSNKSNVNLINVTAVEGSTYGVNLNQSDLTIRNTKKPSCTIKGDSYGIKINASVEGTYSLKMEGPITITGDPNSLIANNVSIIEKGVTYTKDIQTNNCLINGSFSSVGSISDDSSIINLLRYVVNGKTQVKSNAILNAMKSKLVDTIYLDNSVFYSSLNELSAGFQYISKSTYLGLKTNVKDKIEGENSFVGQFGGQLLHTNLINNSTIIFGAIPGADIVTKDFGTVSATAGISNEQGNLIFHTKAAIVQKALQFNGYYSDTSISLSEQDTEITSRVAAVKMTANTLISSRIGESIYLTITTGAMTGQAPSIYWNP